MDMFKKKYTLRHYSPQKVKKGYATSSFTDKVVLLDVQPLTNAELMALPEGDRSVKRIKSFGSFPITTADQAKSTLADKLFYNGEWYECVMSVYWDHTPLSHYRSEFVQVSEASAKAEKKKSTASKKGKNNGGNGGDVDENK